MFGVVGTRVRQAHHLSKRFFASLSDQRPSVADDQWVRSLLLPHAISMLAFAGAMIAEETAGSNRTTLDLNLAIAGYVADPRRYQ